MTFRIGIDARMINHSGIGVRIQNVLQFWKDPFPDTELYIFGDPDLLENYILPKHSKIIRYKAKIYSIRELFGHPLMKKMDLLDIPHFNAPLKYLHKSIVTIHDLIPWVMREFHSSWIKRIYLRINLNRIFKKSKQIVAVSEFTAVDIEREFGMPSNGIVVIHNGIDHYLYRSQPISKVESFKKKYNLPEKFFLTVGIGKGHKNQKFLIDCLGNEWMKEANMPPLVIAGVGGKIPNYLKDTYEKWKRKIIILPRISDREMPLMYQSAFILIFPSLYEGFGFPVVEASAMGTLVLSSNATVLPEVLGEGALYFDPYSAESFSTQLHASLQLKASKRKIITSLAQRHSKKFNWDKTVIEIQKNYLRIAKMM
ncbi:glycosyltransferase family 4 protein [Leptospira sp. GIMC2001]|uniref:glycosyltransferase family 4 protein n=1 Tax=Leptospira sp. GIMC2001 TaxID=1513297 RepID=UPI002349F396|nr:glycosyltransferase family 1 protein [Leptospira sp. GIMC2001]WCL49492.1 glycosyltransferase family 1 protein [Leptospira sp. GIMC2001]